MSLQRNNFLSIIPKQTIRPSLTLNLLADDDVTVVAEDLRFYLLRMAPTADRTITLPNAADVVKAFPKIGQGNGLEFVVQHVGTANEIDLAAGTGGTLSGETRTQSGETRRFFLRLDDGDTGNNNAAYTVYNLGAGASVQPVTIGVCGQLEVGPAAPPQLVTGGGVAGTDSTLGDAGTWLAFNNNQGSLVPNLRTSNPNYNYGMERWDTSLTTFDGDNIYALRLTPAAPDEFFGIYRYEINMIFYINTVQANDRGHLYRVMLARNGVPIPDPYNTQGNNSQFTNAAIHPYTHGDTPFPLDGPWGITVAGLTYINDIDDYFCPYVQNFDNDLGAENQNPLDIESCTLSMNRVAPLPTRRSDAQQEILNLLP